MNQGTERVDGAAEASGRQPEFLLQPAGPGYPAVAHIPVPGVHPRRAGGKTEQGLAFAQRVVLRPPIGDVDVDAEHTGRAAGGIERRDAAQGKQPALFAAVGAAQAEFHVVGGILAGTEAVHGVEDEDLVVRVDHREPVREGWRWSALGIEAVQAELFRRPGHRVAGGIPFPGADAGGFLREAQAVADGFQGFAGVRGLAPGEHAGGGVVRGDQEDAGRIRVGHDVEVPPGCRVARAGGEAEGAPFGEGLQARGEAASLREQAVQRLAVRAGCRADLADPGGVGGPNAAVRDGDRRHGTRQGRNDTRQEAAGRGVYWRGR